MLLEWGLPMSAGPQNFRRHWLLPTVFLLTAAAGVFWSFYFIDHFMTGGAGERPWRGPVDRYVHFDPTSITDAVSSLASMIAAVFGIVITVVSIIVQLS